MTNSEIIKNLLKIMLSEATRDELYDEISNIHIALSEYEKSMRMSQAVIRKNITNKIKGGRKQ